MNSWDVHIKGIWGLQIKKKKMAGTHFILCEQDVTYLQILTELEKVFKTSYILYFAPNQSTLFSAFCEEL